MPALPVIQSQASYLAHILLVFERPAATVTVSVWCFSRPAGSDIGEGLTRTQTLKQQLQKLHEELYHLDWSIKDVTERALHEALKQSKLPGFSGLVRPCCRRLYSEVSFLPPDFILLQFPVPASQKACVAGASAVHAHTSFPLAPHFCMGEESAVMGVTVALLTPSSE